MKKYLSILAVIAALCAMVALAGCGAKDDAAPADDAAPVEQEIIVASFGTSFDDSRDITIGAVEDAIAAANPDWAVARGFTAQTIVDILNDRGIETMNFADAVAAAKEAGVKTLVVQPTHLMAGDEYQDLEAELNEYKGDFEKVALGKNLLDSDEDFQVVADAIVEVTAEYDAPDTAIVFMGHGTPALDDGSRAPSNQVYDKLQQLLIDNGHDNYYIGTVEAEPSLDTVVAALKDKGYTKVVLRPLMVVAGDHANNDMADTEDPESWASVLTAEGYEVTSVIEGLGQIPAIQDLYVKHVADAIASLG